MTAKQLRDLLAVVSEKAPSLRASGVVRVQVDGVDVQLSSADAAEDGERLPPAEDNDPLNDPSTFGGYVPGYERLRERADDD